jgi:uncharacterized protein YjiS (DUF1127 family)
MTDTPFRAFDRLLAMPPRDALAVMVRAWRRERALRATTELLASMNDHTLRDVGLARGELRDGVRRRADPG